MKDFLKFNCIKQKVTKRYAKHLFKNTQDLKKLLKQEKIELRKNKQLEDILDKKVVVKVGKLFTYVTNNGELKNWIRKEMTEAEFTTRFVTPLIDLILKPYKSNLIFKPGEQNLIIVKEYENSALTEDDVRLPGPNIDDVIKSNKLGMVFSILEVSGSPASPAENFNHYIGDRNKLSNNLKYLFKSIISMKGTPYLNSASRVKLFGIQLYSDHIYIYSVSMPMWDVFVFTPNLTLIFQLIQLYSHLLCQHLFLNCSNWVNCFSTFQMN